MKRLLWLLLLLAPSLQAQVVGPGFVNYVTSAPSGACSQGAPMQVVMGLGTVYTCQSGTWATVGGGGAGTVTSVLGTTNQITSDGSTTTPTLSIPATFIAPGSIAATTSLSSGANSGAAGVLNLLGLTTGTASCTAPAVAGTRTNPVTCTNPFALPQGSAAGPALAIGDTNTGLAQIDGSGSLSIINSGSRKHTFDATRYALVADTANIQLGGSSDVNVSRDGAGVIDIGTGAAASKAGSINLTNLTATGSVTIPTQADGNSSTLAATTAFVHISDMVSFCTGTVGTSNATEYVLAPAATGTACTGTAKVEVPVSHACTLTKLYVKAGSNGATAGSGVIKVYKNTVATAITCTLGTGATCNDTAHTVALVAGDSWGVTSLTGQATDTTANIKAALQCQ